MTAIDLSKCTEAELRLLVSMGSIEAAELLYGGAEQKDIVRTLLGERRFGQPIGTEIVRDQIPRLGRQALGAASGRMSDPKIVRDADGVEARRDENARLTLDNDPGWKPAYRRVIEEALRHYRNWMFRPLNEYLREDGPARIERGHGKYDMLMQTVYMDDALSAAPLRHPVVLYRGGDIPGLDPGVGINTPLPDSMVGHSWDDPGFLSTSAKYEVGRTFQSLNHDVVMRLHVPAGTGAIQLTSWPNSERHWLRKNDEAELLLERNLHFEVFADQVEQTGTYTAWERDEHGREHRVDRPVYARILDVEVTRHPENLEEKSILRHIASPQGMVKYHGKIGDPIIAHDDPSQWIRDASAYDEPYQPGRWKALDQQADLARQMYDQAVAQHGADKVHAHYGGSRESFLEWAHPHAAQHMAPVLTLMNGPHTIIVETQRQGDGKLVTAMLDDLITSNPIGEPITLRISKEEEMPHGRYDTVLGLAWLRTGHMQLNDAIFASHDPYKDTGHEMPVAAHVRKASYVLAHEYGHLLDARDTGSISHRIFGDAWNDLWGRRFRFLSRYGRTNDHEAYAELFAEFFLSNGQTDNVLAQQFARRFGWKVGSVQWTL